MKTCDRCHLRAGFVPGGYTEVSKGRCGCGYYGEMTDRSGWVPFVPQDDLQAEVFEKVVKAGLAWSPIKTVLGSVYLSVGSVDSVRQAMGGRRVERVASSKAHPNLDRVCITMGNSREETV